MINLSRKVTRNEIHPILPRTEKSIEPKEAVRKSGKTAKPSFRIHPRSYPGRLAYIHAHPLMIVGKDTIASHDGGHMGTGGVGRTGVDCGGGRILKEVRNVMYGGRLESVRSPGGGEVYVCARDDMHVLS